MGRTLPLAVLLVGLVALLLTGVAAAKKDADDGAKAERAEAREAAREERREAKQEAREERQAEREAARAPEPAPDPAPAAPVPEPAVVPVVVPPEPPKHEEKREAQEERASEREVPRDAPLELHSIVPPPQVALAVELVPLAVPLPAVPAPVVVAVPLNLQPVAAAPAPLREVAPLVVRVVPEAPAPVPALPSPGTMVPYQPPVVEPPRAPAPAPLPAMPRGAPVVPDVQPPRPLPPTPRAPLLPGLPDLVPEGFWRRLAPEGWKRVFPGNVAEHPVRARLLARVRASPGIHLRALARDLDLTPQNAAHHLRHLEACGLLAAAREGQRTRYFSVEGGRAVREAAVDRSFLEAQQRRRIVEALLEAPGLPARALAERLGAAETGVRWNLRRLAARGLVEESADGPRRVYVPTERGALALEEPAGEP